ncbi:MAG: 50S ribosomal protein L6 [Planctomycetota bacterium]|nr:MAG: 50S ribosomal protein L6 [Planctomycetota bacterium]
MSRIGKKPIMVPSGIKIELKDRTIKTVGPKGELSWSYPREIKVEYEEASSQIRVTRSSDESRIRALHGLTRALIANMIHGVDKGYEKKLEIYGTGYGCGIKGKNLLLNVGFMGRGIDSRGKAREAQFNITIPAGLTVNVEVPNARGDTEPAKLTISGADKQQVGEFAAEIRAIRPPEPYKGKGIRYVDEQVKRKQGKAFASGAA